MAHPTAHQIKTPAIRIHNCNDKPIQKSGDYVLYWMVSNRRTTWNFALQRAIEWSITLQKPLLVFEALRVDYPWACDRFHRFVMDGMLDNLAEFRDANIGYYPYIEPEPNASKGLLSSLCKKACILISDEFPCFFIPKMQKKFAKNF